MHYTIYLNKFDNSGASYYDSAKKHSVHLNVANFSFLL